MAFSSAEDLPIFALQDDRVVEVVGDPAGVHKALELIASHLRKFLVDRGVIPIFEMNVSVISSLTCEEPIFIIRNKLINACGSPFVSAFFQEK